MAVTTATVAQEKIDAITSEIAGIDALITSKQGAVDAATTALATLQTEKQDLIDRKAALQDTAGIFQTAIDNDNGSETPTP